MNGLKRSKNGGDRTAAAESPGVRLVMRPTPDVTKGVVRVSNRDTIVPIERGLAVLEAFRASDSWLGNLEIAERTSIPKATVTRLTSTLTACGCLRRSPTLRKFRLAPGVLGLGYAAIVNTDVVTIAMPLMQQLADENCVFVCLASRDGLDMVLLENCHSASTRVTLGVQVGKHVPLAATAVGQALLAALPGDERKYLLERVLHPYDKNHRILLRERVDDAVHQVQEKGYCVSIGIWNPEVSVVAAPLLIPNRPAMAIACIGPKTQVTKAQLAQQIAPKLAELISVLQAAKWNDHD
jgi:DNA-binding IclR family transcriptional regulator